jgi:hypothetical protein
MIRAARQTLATMLGSFSLLVFSAYLILWQQSNQDVRLAAGSLLLFLAAVTLSPDRSATIGVTFLFSGFHWLVLALISSDRRDALTALGLLLVPASIMVLTSWKERAAAGKVLLPEQRIQLAE